MNSYWVAHASAQKITETTNHCESVYLFNIDRMQIAGRQTETMDQQRVGRFES